MSRPVYRVGEIPDGLATVTMLRRMRRRLADGQEPVASLRYRGNKYADLFEVAGAVELPALSDRQRARWVLLRTCARCQATHPTPYPVRYETGRRLCQSCDRVERLAAARPSWLRLRHEAVVWAGEVLADPDAVVLAVYEHGSAELGWGCPVDVHARTLAGEVLVDVTMVPARPQSRRVLAAGAIVADDIVPHLMPLVGRRLVYTICNHRGGYADHVTPLGVVAQLSTWLWRFDGGLADPSIRQDPGDGFGARWTDWHARTCSNGDGLHRGHHNRYGLDRIPVPGDSATDLTAAMRTGLALMAVDEHPDGPPACPWLPPTGLTPCGDPAGPGGLCAGHPPVVEP